MSLPNHFLYFSTKESEFLHRSPVPTYHFQPSLPRLPIPKLEDTSRRYLDAQKPLLTPEQYEDVKRITEDFIGHEGKGIFYKSNYEFAAFATFESP